MIVNVLIIDLSGFTQSWKTLLKKIITRGKMSDPNYSLKPFDCSLCSTFWTGLIWLIATNQFTLTSLTLLTLVAVLGTGVAGQLLVLIREIILYIIKKIYAKVY